MKARLDVVGHEHRLTQADLKNSHVAADAQPGRTLQLARLSGGALERVFRLDFDSFQCREGRLLGCGLLSNLFVRPLILSG